MDYSPHPEGNIVILNDEATVFGKPIGEPVIAAYRSHFATCPSARKHRKRGKKGGAE